MLGLKPLDADKVLKHINKLECNSVIQNSASATLTNQTSSQVPHTSPIEHVSLQQYNALSTQTKSNSFSALPVSLLKTLPLIDARSRSANQQALEVNSFETTYSNDEVQIGRVEGSKAKFYTYEGQSYSTWEEMLACAKQGKNLDGFFHSSIGGGSKSLIDNTYRYF